MTPLLVIVGGLLVVALVTLALDLLPSSPSTDSWDETYWDGPR